MLVSQESCAYTILYYNTIPHHTTPYYTILAHTILQYNAMLYDTILYYAILYYTIPYYIVHRINVPLRPQGEETGGGLWIMSDSMSTGIIMVLIIAYTN